MPTLLERLTRTHTESFGIMDADGNTWFVEANRCEAVNGKLIFFIGASIVAAVNDGMWQRVMRGLSVSDLEAAEQ